MPVRLRITLLFFVLVLFILGIVCVGIYFFSYSSRISSISMRLRNRDITVARLLSRSEVFDHTMIYRIDSATALALKDKTVQAYDENGIRIYDYSDVAHDSIAMTASLLKRIRQNGTIYFTKGEKDVVGYYYHDPNASLVMVSAGVDVDGRQHLSQLRIILLAVFLIGLTIALAGGYFFSRELVSPVRKIADNVNEISTQNLARRIPTGPSRDEWSYLTETLNRLLDRIQEGFELQRRFIANASHELSTPLTSISSQLEVSLQRDRSAEEYRKILYSVLQDVRHMNKLTQILLEFAKASGSSGGLEIHPVRVDEVLLRLPAEIQKLNKDFSVSLQFGEMLA